MTLTKKAFFKGFILCHFASWVVTKVCGLDSVSIACLKFPIACISWLYLEIVIILFACKSATKIFLKALILQILCRPEWFLHLTSDLHLLCTQRINHQDSDDGPKINISAVQKVIPARLSCKENKYTLPISRRSKKQTALICNSSVHNGESVGIFVYEQGKRKRGWGGEKRRKLARSFEREI